MATIQSAAERVFGTNEMMNAIAQHLSALDFAKLTTILRPKMTELLTASTTLHQHHFQQHRNDNEIPTLSPAVPEILSFSGWEVTRFRSSEKGPCCLSLKRCNPTPKAHPYLIPTDMKVVSHARDIYIATEGKDTVFGTASLADVFFLPPEEGRVGNLIAELEPLADELDQKMLETEAEQSEWVPVIGRALELLKVDDSDRNMRVMRYCVRCQPIACSRGLLKLLYRMATDYHCGPCETRESAKGELLFVHFCSHLLRIVDTVHSSSQPDALRSVVKVEREVPPRNAELLTSSMMYRSSSPVHFCHSFIDSARICSSSFVILVYEYTHRCTECW